MHSDSDAVRFPLERHHKDGAVMIWPRHLAVLQGLLDRPGGHAFSRLDCVRAAWPYCIRLTGYGADIGVMRYILPRVIKRGWITMARVGSRNEYTLTDRGRAIVEGEVCIRMFGGREWKARSKHIAPSALGS
jgi:hypothetical protein